MNDRKLKAFDTVTEWSKQIVTIASGTLVLSATFIKDIFGGKIISLNLLWWAWLTLILSIAFGVMVLGSLASALNDDGALDLYRPGIIVSSLAQVGSFLTALVLFSTFAYLNLAGSFPTTPRAEPMTSVNSLQTRRLPANLLALSAINAFKKSHASQKQMVAGTSLKVFQALITPMKCVRRWRLC